MLVDEAFFFELIGERWNGDVMPVNDLVGAVVYGMDTSNVDSVYVGGPARKQAGQLVGADPAESRTKPSPRAPASRAK
jgi:hypothetical protein